MKIRFFREFPLWAAYAVAYSLVDVYADELKTANAPFDEGDYGAIDATVWCPDVIHHLEMFLSKLATNSIPLPSNFLFVGDDDDKKWSCSLVLLTVPLLLLFKKVPKTCI